MNAVAQEPIKSAVAAQGRPSVSRGALWSAADFWLQQTSQLLTFVVVGSLLGPRVIGVMTMALTTLVFLMNLITGGLADALVQRADLRKDHFDTAFWLLLGAGVCGAAILAGGAPLIAWLFSEPALNEILPVLALSLPFIGITATYQAMLQRELCFRQLATRSMVAYTTGFVTAVALARMGFGIWSLVVSVLVTRLLDAVLIVIVSKLRPGGNITRSALVDIIDYGKHRVGTQFMGIIGMQVDRIMIGVFLGPVALGLYSIAERIIMAFTFGVSGVIQRVAFPALALVQSDRPAFDSALRQFLTSTSVISWPLFLGIVITSHDSIAVLFPEIWLPASVPLAILGIAALVHPVNFLLTTATNAVGHSRLVLRYSVVIIGLRVIGSVIGAQFGMVAVALANLTVNLLSPVIVVAATSRLFGGKWRHYLVGIWPAVAASLLMAAAVLGATVVIGGLPPLALLVAKVGLGAACYMLALRTLAPELYCGIVSIITARA